MQRFLFIDCYLILALQNPLHRTINISSSNHKTNSTQNLTTNDFDHPEVLTSINHFIKWFTPILVTLSLLIALVCPFLLWILQERCLNHSSSETNHQLITTPRLLLVDPRTQISSNPHSPKSLHSSKQTNSYYTPPTSSSEMV